MKMKQELLEYLVRHCVREVLSQVNESDNNFHTDSQGEWCKECGGKSKKDIFGNCKCSNSKCKSDSKKLPNTDLKKPEVWNRIREEGDEEIKGAAAQPVDVPVADQPFDNKSKDTRPESPSGKETSQETSLKGTVLVNPRDKSNLRRIPISSKNDAVVERELYRLATTVGGRGTKVALATRNAVKSTLSNPKETIYLYIGKYDEASEEVFLLADKSLQVAKEQSLPMEVLPKAAIPTDPNVIPKEKDPLDPFNQPDPNAVVDPNAAEPPEGGIPGSSPVYPPGSEEDAANDYDFIQSVPKLYGVNEPIRIPDDPDSNDQIDEVKKLVKKMVKEVLNRK